MLVLLPALGAAGYYTYYIMYYSATVQCAAHSTGAVPALSVLIHISKDSAGTAPVLQYLHLCSRELRSRRGIMPVYC